MNTERLNNQTTPAEVIVSYIKSLRGDDGALHFAFAKNMHGVGHVFMDWRSAMISCGSVADLTGPEALAREPKLFNQFVRLLKQNGVILTRAEKKQAFQEYLDD